MPVSIFGLIGQSRHFWSLLRYDSLTVGPSQVLAMRNLFRRSALSTAKEANWRPVARRRSRLGPAVNEFLVDCCWGMGPSRVGPARSRWRWL